MNRENPFRLVETDDIVKQGLSKDETKESKRIPIYERYKQAIKGKTVSRSDVVKSIKNRGDEEKRVNETKQETPLDALFQSIGIEVAQFLNEPDNTHDEKTPTSLERDEFRKKFPLNARQLRSVALRKDSLHDFISKKREMLMVEMAINTKKKEVEKIAKISEERSNHLDQVEMKLEADALKFDKFLKDSDLQTQEATKVAEKETKLKQSKVEEIKAVKQLISLSQAEISRLKEQRDNCIKYKRFLLELDAQRHVSNITEAEDDDNGEKLSFLLPDELLNLYADMEEDALFILKNSQEAEREFNTVQKQYHRTKLKYEKKISSLSQEVEALGQQITNVTETGNPSVKRPYGALSSSTRDAEVELRAITTAVATIERRARKVCIDAGLLQSANDSTSNQTETLEDEPTTDKGLLLSLLADIEECVEECISRMSRFERDQVDIEEKKREKERRDRIRKQKAEEQEELMEQKLRARMMKQEKSKINSNNPSDGNLNRPKKQKPVMFRSYLNKQTVLENQNSISTSGQNTDTKDETNSVEEFFA